MNKKAFSAAIVPALLSLTVTAHAELKVSGRFETMTVDISKFPPKMKEAYSLFKVKCSQCHRLDRTLSTIKSGITPSGVEFDNAAVNAYGHKMLRKPDAKMNKQDVKVVVELLRYMLDEEAKK